MKLIVDKITGKILFGSSIPVELQENEIEIDFISTEGFTTPYINLETMQVYEGATQEDIAAIKIDLETQTYLKRITDGANAIAKFSAELRVAKLAGTISEEGHKVIDKALKPIRDEVLAGQWISAKDELVALGTDIIGQNLYDRIYVELDTYIQLNY